MTGEWSDPDDRQTTVCLGDSQVGDKPTRRHESVNSATTYFQVNKLRQDQVYWRCWTRDAVGCGVTVVQVGDSFHFQRQRGRHDHLDAPVLGVYNATQMRANIKPAATADVFKSAARIVDEEKCLWPRRYRPLRGFSEPRSTCSCRQSRPSTT